MFTPVPASEYLDSILKRIKSNYMDKGLNGTQRKGNYIQYLE